LRPAPFHYTPADGPRDRPLPTTATRIRPSLSTCGFHPQRERARQNEGDLQVVSRRAARSPRPPGSLLYLGGHLTGPRSVLSTHTAAACASGGRKPSKESSLRATVLGALRS